MILRCAFIAQEHGGAVILTDEQIGRAVVVVVAGDDRAGLLELNLVEADISRDVFESIWAEVAE